MSEPDYYNGNGLSPLSAFEMGLISREECIGFCKGNVIKYVVRAGKKGDSGLEDIVKAMDYLHHLYVLLDDDGDVGICFSDYDGIEKSGLDCMIDEFKGRYGL